MPSWQRMAKPHPFLRRLLLTLGLMPVLGLAVLAADNLLPVTAEGGGQPPAEGSEFQFIRMIYSSGMNFGRGSRWLTDWPEAEEHLIGGVRRLTRINIGAEGEQLEIMDDALFDHPWIYAVEVGSWMLEDNEVARLRDYLLRGGFLMVDDFHGSREWEGFTSSMRRVFPDRPIVEIPMDDAVFHAVYDLEDRVQIPGIISLSTGLTYERDGYTPHWRGIYDDQGRLMVVINFNMDLGDAWEHADVPEYALQYTTRAYKYAINYVLYAMTH
jgi:Domain of unknown function (DUF4159)